MTLRCADWSQVHDVGEVEIDGLEELVFVERIVILVVSWIRFFPVQHLQQKAVTSLGEKMVPFHMHLPRGQIPADST